MIEQQRCWIAYILPVAHFASGSYFRLFNPGPLPTEPPFSTRKKHRTPTNKPKESLGKILCTHHSAVAISLRAPSWPSPPNSIDADSRARFGCVSPLRIELTDAIYHKRRRSRGRRNEEPGEEDQHCERKSIGGVGTYINARRGHLAAEEVCRASADCGPIEQI